jgi:hypothetical protein
MVIARDYKEFEKYGEAFFAGRTQLMVVTGEPGIGKSEMFKRMNEKRGNPAVFHHGHSTPTAIIRELYEHPDADHIIDDNKGLFNANSIQSVMLQGFDTGKERKISYNSPSQLVADIPKEFIVTGNLCIISNGLNDNDFVKAFQSRAVCVEFKPTPEERIAKLKEIVRVAADFPKDGEVLAAFERLAPFAKAANFRAYKHAADMKPSGVNWLDLLSDEMKVEPMYAAVIQANNQGKTFKERAAIFTKITGKTERTYSRTMKEMGAY